MSRSLIDQKASFLRSQIRLLTAPLSPSPDWQEFAEEPESGDLPDKVINDVLQKLNATAKNHHRTVYSSQAVRAVAEQIDTLYTTSITGESNDATTGLVRGVLEKGSDLTLPVNIALLPEEWPSAEAASTMSEQDERYAELRERILELDAKRTELREKLAKYKQLQTLVAPLSDPRVNVQPNLVTKDGELAGQLERMRVLLARVGGRVGDSGPREGSGMEADVGLSAEEKLKAILEGR